MICPICSHPNTEPTDRCVGCGAILLAHSCSHCGAALPIDAKFCGQCGENLVAAEALLGEGTGWVALDNPAESSSVTSGGGPQTRLQPQTVTLLHLQTNTVIELTPHLSVIHIGKPNQRVPPEIDVSSFPNADIVSRVHAAIGAEGAHFYIEDVGSSNGTYVNNVLLLPQERHRLQVGDRITLGKGDLMTFLFQLS